VALTLFGAVLTDGREIEHCRATTDEVRRWIEAGPPAIVTLAPEVAGGMDATRALVDAGTVVSIGRSGAAAEQVRAALAAGRATRRTSSTPRRRSTTASPAPPGRCSRATRRWT